jgi:hypothetical protein
MRGSLTPDLANIAPQDDEPRGREQLFEKPHGQQMVIADFLEPPGGVGAIEGPEILQIVADWKAIRPASKI